MQEIIKWDNAGINERRAVCELLGWRTHKNTITKTGLKIASKSFDNQSSCVKEIFKRHGIQK